jgi:hypothetical protein
MKPTHACTWNIALISLSSAIAIALAGCSDFSQHRFGGVRELHLAAKPALQTDPPPLLEKKPGEIKQVEFKLERDPLPLDPQALAKTLRGLHQRAAQRVAKMDSYIYRMKRREVVNGAKRPEELVLVKIRREPYSVYLKWLAVNKGREVVYVQGKYDNTMQVRTAAGDIPFVPAGKHMSFHCDSALVKSNSRHAITETGLGTVVERFGRLVTALEKNDPSEGKAKYLGKVKRPEFEQPVEAVHHEIPPDLESLLPKGGERWYFFDATSGLPVLVITHDASGEVEYYCNDHIQWPVRLDEDDFHPDWMRKR